MPDPIKVQDPSPEVKGMMEEWQLARDLLGGTPAMRKGGYLQKYSLETNEDFAIRCEAATLVPMFEKTVEKLTGRTFAEPLKIGEDVPEWIQKEVLEDVDRTRRGIQTFARESFFHGLAKGLTYWLCDAPRIATGVARTLDEQQRAGLRPYGLWISAERVLGWIPGEKGKLQQVRIKFCRTERDGEFGTREVPQVRVYEMVGGRVRITTYEPQRREDGSFGEDYIPIGDPPVILDAKVKEIPLVAFYTKRTGFMTAVSPLRELAYLNLKYYRKQSGIDSLETLTTVPILTTSGLEENDEIKIGSRSAISLPINGKMEFVEHTGQAVETGFKSLENLMHEMEQAGAKLLQPGSGRSSTDSPATKTATQSKEEAAGSNSELGSIVQDFKDALAMFLRVLSWFRGDDNGGTLIPQPNLDPDMPAVPIGSLLLQMANAGKLSDQTLFEELQRRDLISEEIDFEAEQARLTEQMARVGDSLGNPPGTGANNPRPGARSGAGQGASGSGAA